MGGILSESYEVDEEFEDENGRKHRRKIKGSKFEVKVDATGSVISWMRGGNTIVQMIYLR